MKYRVNVDRSGSGAILSLIDEEGVTRFIYSPIEGPGVACAADEDQTYALVDTIVKLTYHRRLPTSPTGEYMLVCDERVTVYGRVNRVCGHSWADHDDDGCLWHFCPCSQPGERK